MDEKIREILKNGGVIAFPTDTVWGIGCLPENQKAVEKIYSIKSRDAGKPLILLGKNLESLLPYIEKLPENALKIAKKYFPGAVTLVVKKSSLTPDFVTADFDTVGIRVPDCPIFAEMLEKCTDNGILATTSANISEMGAVSTKEEVINSIGDKIDYILDDFGFTPKGTESTVVFVNEAEELKILRQGAVEVKI
ncbi:MAG TPA: threonylcarbamoyl-AMP synthase [Cyanobacteria bacterium UBA9971]|nr:threonylcarbamoyl-AMP synthase [Cyanobacteria bacterium UBA9971]